MATSSARPRKSEAKGRPRSEYFAKPEVDSSGRQALNWSHEDIQYWMSNLPNLCKQLEESRNLIKTLEEQRDQEQQAMHQLKSELSKRDVALASLQESMLQDRDRFQPVEDKKVKQDIETLSSNIKTLSMNIKQQICLSSAELKPILIPGMLCGDVQDAAWKDKKVWKHMLSSFIWKSLFEILFERPFQVYGEEGEAALVAFKIMFQGTLYNFSDVAMCQHRTI